MSEVYCPKCKVRVPAGTSKRGDGHYVRYHYCACGYKAVSTVRADRVWSRKSSTIETGTATTRTN